MALHYFLERTVQVGIIEVGVGGRIDPTNIFPTESVLAVGLTPIGFDHMELLGDTLPEIAAEKAAICQPGVPALTVASQDPAAMVALKATALSRGAQLRVVPRFESYDGWLPTHRLGLAGDHQRENAALALGLVRVVCGERVPLAGNRKLSVRNLAALQQVSWPGRGQTLPLREDPGELLCGGQVSVLTRCFCSGCAVHRRRPHAREHACLWPLVREGQAPEHAVGTAVLMSAAAHAGGSAACAAGGASIRRL